ncbi:unnamed protein product [Urochloa humidicola]
MATWRLEPSTLHPPVLSADDVAAAEEILPWVLLELKAYVAKRDNATTAFSRTWDGKRIQVTFCARRPPRASYVCVHSPDAAEIHVEPEIVAVEDRLVVLRITVGPQDDVLNGLLRLPGRRRVRGAVADAPPAAARPLFLQCRRHGHTTALPH